MNKVEKRKILKTIIVFILCIISIFLVTPAQAGELETQIYYKEGEKHTRSAEGITVKKGGSANQQGFIAALKYIDPTGSEQPNKKKMTYCLNEGKDAPEGTMERDEKGMLNKEILYCISTGVRYWGEESVKEEYRTGLGFKGDYLATTFAVHVSNREFTLEDLKDDAYCAILGIPKRELEGSVWRSIVKMVEDAEASTMQNNWIPPNAAYDVMPNIVNTWVPYTCKGVKGYRTNAAFHQTTGDVNNIRNVKVSLAENSKTASLVFLKNEELGVSASSSAADFQVFLPAKVYEKMQRTGGSIPVQITGEQVEYYANWQYTTQNPKEQPSTYLEPVYAKEGFTRMVEAVVERTYRKGSVSIEKKDKETGDVLEETVFTIYEWSKKAGDWVKQSELQFSKEKQCYQGDDLLETEDNEARFRVVETKPQEDYLNSGWTKELELYEKSKPDFSYIVTNIKKKPLLSVAKLADKTKGVTLEKGRYKGTKQMGTYQVGERVCYKITVSNPGNIEIKDICVVEKLSEKLQKSIQENSAKFVGNKSKKIMTKNGKTVKIIEKSPTQVVVEQLEKGDSLELLFELQLRKEGSEKKEILENVVYVEGSYNSGSQEKKIETDEDDKDQDEIEVLPIKIIPPGEETIPPKEESTPPPEEAAAPKEETIKKEIIKVEAPPKELKIHTVKTADASTWKEALLIFALSAALMIYLFAKNRKKRNSQSN